MKPGGVWGQPRFRRFWVGETTSQVGSAVTTVVLPLAAVRLHASALSVSLLTAATWLPWLLIGLPAGAWVDRLSSRRVMVSCDLISAALYLSVPVAAWAGVLSVGQLLAVALLGGSCAVLFRTAYAVYLPTLVPPERLTGANAALTGSTAAAQIGGPGLGGVIAQIAGAATGLLADAASFAVSLICIAGLPPDRPRDRSAGQRSSTLRAEIIEGVRFLAHDPLLRPLSLFSAAGNFGLTGLEAILVVFLVRTVHLSAGGVGAVLSLIGVGGVLGAVIAGPLGRRFGTARATVWGAIISSPFALLIPLTGSGPGLAFLLVGDLVVAISVALGNVLSDVFEQTYVPAAVLGRVVACGRVMAFSVMPLGAATAGLLASQFGLRTALWAMTGCLATSALILLPTAARRMRDFPARPPSGEPELTANYAAARTPGASDASG